MVVDELKKEVSKDWIDNVVKNIVGEEELTLPFNKKAGILKRRLP